MVNDAAEINLKASSSLLLEWLQNAREGKESILFVIGAGLSMTGHSTAPSGNHIAGKYEGFLRSQGINIPKSKSNNIAKLYEHFCYPEVDGKKQFSMEQHNIFIDKITTNSGEHRFIGEPNFQHRSLINEVQEADGNIRLYSLNLDDYFEVAESLSDKGEGKNVINSHDLVGKPLRNNIFRDWRILAAHGKNNIDTRSVWSDSLLNSPLLSDDDTPEYLKKERALLENAIKCIENGPYFSKIIFVGLNAPLTYLMTALKHKVTEECEWAWVNPYSEPAVWVERDSEGLFNNENGYWFRNRLDKILWHSQAGFYERWLSASCEINQEDIPLLNKYNGRETVFVESIYRARRIYKEAIGKLAVSGSNLESVKFLNKNQNAYKYPELDNGYKYVDSNLGVSLHKLFIKEIELIPLASEQFPNLTVAGKFSDESPISAHIFKFDSLVSESDLANGIAESFEDAVVKPSRRHIIVLDVENYHIESLIKAIGVAVKEKFIDNPMHIDIITYDELDEFLHNNDFTKTPERAWRP